MYNQIVSKFHLTRAFFCACFALDYATPPFHGKGGDVHMSSNYAKHSVLARNINHAAESHPGPRFSRTPTIMIS